MKVTDTEIKIMRLLKDNCGRYGTEIARVGKIRKTTVYVLLMRLVDKGMVKSDRPRIAWHPGLARPAYRLTAAGERMVKAEDARAAVLK